MLKWLARRGVRKRNAHNLYGSIVALSRNPGLYTDLNIPDSLEGRFETIVLHMYVVLERLHGEDDILGQDIVDRFFADMDTTQRELGVGDMAVPRKMRSLAALFQDRMTAYKTILSAGDTQSIASLLEENLYAGGKAQDRDIEALVDYVAQSRKRFSGMTLDQLKSGRSASLPPAGTSR